MSEVDWKTEVEAYALKSEQHAARVVAAKVQASGLSGTDEFWEAVYTLVNQRAQMEGARDE